VVRELARDPEFDITVAAPRFFRGDLRPIEIEPEPPGSPLRIVPLDTKWSRFIHVFRFDGLALRALIDDGDFDLVHAWEEPYIFAGYQIARAVKNSPAKCCFATFQNYVKRYPPPFGYFERTVLKRADGWIAFAGLVFQAMLDRGYPAATGRILDVAVDLSQFRPLPSATKAEVLEELGLTPPVVGFVGRLALAKGLDVLMQAMEQIGSSRPWQLLLLGSGEYKEKVLHWAARNGWPDRVKIILAKHSEVPRNLGCMDLLVAPSQTLRNWKEQFGRMIVEAFACGVPVIGSDSGEIPYVIGDAGKVIPEADVKGWASAIEQLLENSELREELSKRGLERAQRYSASTVAQQYREYFRWLVRSDEGFSSGLEEGPE
jgi:glycosyltransferase involved in cell wall biosynthesis